MEHVDTQEMIWGIIKGPGVVANNNHSTSGEHLPSDEVGRQALGLKYQRLLEDVYKMASERNTCTPKKRSPDVAIHLTIMFFSLSETLCFRAVPVSSGTNILTPGLTHQWTQEPGKDVSVRNIRFHGRGSKGVELDELSQDGLSCLPCMP